MIIINKWADVVLYSVSSSGGAGAPIAQGQITRGGQADIDIAPNSGVYRLDIGLPADTHNQLYDKFSSMLTGQETVEISVS